MAPPDGLARALRQTDGIPAPIEPLGHIATGFFSYVFGTASGWVVRVARTPLAGERQLCETRFLPWLAGQLTVAVPSPCVVVDAAEGVPHGAVACPALPGRVIGPGESGWVADAFTTAMAHALANVHSLDVERANIHGLDAFAPRRERFAGLRARSSLALRERLPGAEFARVEQWWDAFFDDERMDSFTPVVAHGDPWWGNVLQEEGRLTALLDWEHAGIDDPAMDLCTQVHGGEHFMETVVARYARLTGGDEPELLYRSRQLAAMREFFGVEWSAQMHDEAEMAESIAKVLDSSVFR